MRKYILNAGVLGSVFGGWSVLQTSLKGPRDWRLILLWIGWLASVALAVGTVMEDNKKPSITK